MAETHDPFPFGRPWIRSGIYCQPLEIQCKTSYDVSWMRAPHRHCPNLVPIEEDWDTPLRKKPKKIMSTYKVRVLNEQIDQYDSLADLWTVFYKTYMEADFPRLLVRFEDLLFHRENVMAQIVECVTGESAFSSLSSATATTPTDGKSRTHKSTGSWFHEEPLKYRLSPVKEHGRSSDLVSAVIKYGTSRGRYAGMASEDLRYAAKALDPKLLRKFQYLAVPVV